MNLIKSLSLIIFIINNLRSLMAFQQTSFRKRVSMALLQHWKVTILGWQPMVFSLAVFTTDLLLKRTYVRTLDYCWILDRWTKNLLFEWKDFYCLRTIIDIGTISVLKNIFSTKIESWTLFFMKMKRHSK